MVCKRLRAQPPRLQQTASRSSPRSGYTAPTPLFARLMLVENKTQLSPRTHLLRPGLIPPRRPRAGLQRRRRNPRPRPPAAGIDKEIVVVIVVVHERNPGGPPHRLRPRRLVFLGRVDGRWGGGEGLRSERHAGGAQAGTRDVRTGHRQRARA
eukprot:3390684-Rhodomonas_salina.2